MVDTDKLSQIEEKADEILKDHNGVYLEKRLFRTLKQKFPDLSRKDFQNVLEEVLKRGYTLEHALIKPLPNNEKLIKDYDDGKLPGKGSSEIPRIPNKRELE